METKRPNVLIILAICVLYFCPLTMKTLAAESWLDRNSRAGTGLSISHSGSNGRLSITNKFNSSSAISGGLLGIRVSIVHDPDGSSYAGSLKYEAGNYSFEAGNVSVSGLAALIRKPFQDELVSKVTVIPGMSVAQTPFNDPADRDTPGFGLRMPLGNYSGIILSAVPPGLNRQGAYRYGISLSTCFGGEEIQTSVIRHGAAAMETQEPGLYLDGSLQRAASADGLAGGISYSLSGKYIKGVLRALASFDSFGETGGLVNSAISIGSRNVKVNLYKVFYSRSFPLIYTAPSEQLQVRHGARVEWCLPVYNLQLGFDMAESSRFTDITWKDGCFAEREWGISADGDIVGITWNLIDKMHYSYLNHDDSYSLKRNTRLKMQFSMKMIDFSYSSSVTTLNRKKKTYEDKAIISFSGYVDTWKIELIRKEGKLSGSIGAVFNPNRFFGCSMKITSEGDISISFRESRL